MLNLLFRSAESYGGLQEKIIRKLANSDLIDKIVVVSRSDDIPKDLSSVIEYKSEIGWKYKYQYTKEYRCSEPLSRKVLEAIQPFMSTAMAIAFRDTNYDIYTVFEARRLVYTSLRYWLYVIRKNKVNYMLFSYLPHTLHEYVIYALGRALSIPIKIFATTHMPYTFVWGESIESIGDTIKDSFEQDMLNNTDNSGQIKKEQISSFLKKVREQTVPPKRTAAELKSARAFIKEELDRYVTPRSIVSHYYHSLFDKQESKSYQAFYEKKYLKDLYRSIKVYVGQKRIGYYDSRAVEPDYSKPFIYFGLQLTPEATTLPMAGVFDEQLLSVKILARAAKKCGVVVYVKDHYVQPRRDKNFYDELFKIDNVVCIKTDVPSLPLIEKSVAVSTQTGSCILEGFIKHKHSLVFGDCYFWKGMPGLHVINNVKQCEKVIRSVLSGNEKKITDDIVDRYCQAIDRNSVTFESYVSELNPIKLNNYSIDDMVDETFNTYIALIEKDLNNISLK